MNLKFILLLLVLTFLAAACSNDQSTTVKPEQDDVQVKTETYDWLLGNWERNYSEETSSQSFENWIKESDTKYLGHGFTMEGTDTVWEERMVLDKTDSGWIFTAETPGNEDLVSFTMTSSNDQSFTVENPEHDFPKKIEYWMDGELLKARVQADSMKIEFEFKHGEK